MPEHRIVLGTDSGTYWTGRPDDAWTDDPREARTYDSPSAAWRAAVQLRSNEAEYLEDSPVALDLLDPDEPWRPRRAVTTTLANNRLGLRARWRNAFGEALPPDLPNSVSGADTSRLEDYLRDVDWDDLRRRTGALSHAPLPVAPAFADAMSRLAEHAPDAAAALVQQHVPPDLANRLSAQLKTDPRSEARPDSSRVEPNEVQRSELDKSPRPAPDTDLSSPTLPAFVRRHFVRTGDRFFHRQNPDKLAFLMRGDTFRAEEASASVAQALVELAQARGWSSIRVKGSKDFRRMVWTAAAQQGLVVEGYSPSAGEKALFDQAAPSFSERDESRSAGRERERAVDPLSGVLVAHGPAPFQHQPENSPSYFATVRTSAGSETTHWGLDLERALRESEAVVGDRVRLVRQGRQRVQIQEPVRDEDGVVVGQVSKEADRVAWSVSRLARTPASLTDRRRRDQDLHADRDQLAAKVVEMFTAERLAALPAAERTRFRELYDDARNRLADMDPVDRPSFDVRRPRRGERDQAVRSR
jgi:hypothetical protein